MRTRLPLSSVTLSTLLLVALPLAGCGQTSSDSSTENGTPTNQSAQESAESKAAAEAFAGQSLDDIVTAYRGAEKDGQYRTRLLPLTHPTVVAELGDGVYFRDTPEEQQQRLRKTAETITDVSHELEPFTDEEWAESKERAVWPIRPTHTLKLKTEFDANGDGVTSMTAPLNLTRISGDGDAARYGIVLARPLTNDDLVGPFPTDRIGYRRTKLFIAHEWNVPIEAGTAANYRLDLQTDQGATLATLFSPADEILDGERQRKRVAEATNLTIGIGSEETDLRTSDDFADDNASNIRTSFRVGEASGFVAKSVPLTEIVFVRANTEVDHFEQSGLRLYTVTGQRDGQSATYHAVLVKQN